ncbi:MAG: DUF3048 domain-containing protein [Chloroflexota bacterium]|nr:DUF3048 domain-containing protein [Chloroflexota bacterium]
MKLNNKNTELRTQNNPCDTLHPVRCALHGAACTTFSSLIMYRFLLFVLFSLLSACYVADAPPPSAAPTVTPTLAPSATPLPGMIGPEVYPDGVNPLTGMLMENPAALERRPLVVKLSNAPPLVRPQAGIGAADVVFEHYAEGGLTRFSAIFYTNAPERVGSIRSARLIDHELMAMYQGLLGFSGTSEGVGAVLRASEYYERTYIGVAYPEPFYYRDESIPAPHNLFMNAAALWSLAADEGFGQAPPLAGLAFSAPPPAGEGGQANSVQIEYRATRAGWLYDGERGQYLRFSDGQPHLDANTGTQVVADNVVIVYVRHVDTDIVESVWQDQVSWSIQIQLWDEGDAILIRDGQQYRARWRRPERDAALSLVTPEGAPLPLRPGVTWVQLFPLPEQWIAGEEAVEME